MSYDEDWENLVNWGRWQISRERTDSTAKIYHCCQGRIYYKGFSGWHKVYENSDVCNECERKAPKQLMLMLKIVNSSCNED